jgi:hypothetical protein
VSSFPIRIALPWLIPYASIGSLNVRGSISSCKFHTI